MRSVYVTRPQTPRARQMSLDDLLFGDVSLIPRGGRMYDPTGTVTRIIKDPRLNMTETLRLVTVLRNFNRDTEALRSVQDRNSLYYTFYIPKQNGKNRRIDAPEDELMAALRRLKLILDVEFFYPFHTAAFAYVPHRSTVKLMQKHQANKSNWFGKLDFSNFFGSITPEFVMQMLRMIYPFSELFLIEGGREELQTALDFAFLNGGLPQGTPVSPMLTNILMVPFDHKMSKEIDDVCGSNMVYTRYADDIILSSRYEFDIKEVEKYINDNLAHFNAPMHLNTDKTRYGSRAGQNWNLGLMLNKDNEITVGNNNHRHFKTMLRNYAKCVSTGDPWPLDEVQHVLGLYSYYDSVEPETIKQLVGNVSSKCGYDVVRHMKDRLTTEHRRAG